MKKRIAIIGGGASGLICAIQAKQTNPYADITIYEKNAKPGKKILVTGNGRCNFSNTNLSPSHFYGDVTFLRKVLTSVYADDENYFRSLGIFSYEEDGRLYPRSQQSSAIRDALLNKISSLGISIITEHTVCEIKRKDSGFSVDDYYFDAVVLSGGSKASPVHGSDGSCYAFAEGFSHQITPLHPALCGLLTGEKTSSLKGVRAEGNAKLFSGSRLLGEEEGEIQFTDNAVSGIPVMNLSHLCKDNKNLSLTIDLCYDLSFNELFEHIKAQPKTDVIETILSGIINNKLGFMVMEKAGIKPHSTLTKVTVDGVKRLCDTLKGFTLKIKGTKDFTNAQITCGGIDTKDIDPATMMSQIEKGLFFCGEILDIHGDCGGYNLHLAWTTGRIAGNAVAEYIR